MSRILNFTSSRFKHLNSFDDNKKTFKTLRYQAIILILMMFFITSPETASSLNPIYIFMKPLMSFIFIVISALVASNFIQFFYKKRVKYVYALKYSLSIFNILILSSMPYVLNNDPQYNDQSIMLTITIFLTLISLFIISNTKYSLIRNNEVKEIEEDNESLIFDSNLDIEDNEKEILNSTKKEILLSIIGHITKIAIVFLMFTSILVGLTLTI